MPLESCMILLDNSEYMRNGDYIPTRLEAQQDAANLLVGAKTQSHPESTVGVSAGTELLVSPTDDVGKILGALHGLQLHNITPDITASVQVASLALKHRRNKNGAQRIVLFVGSPLSNLDTRQLTKAGRQLKKNNVSIDVVAMGELEENEEKLRELVDAANGRAASAESADASERTCHLVTIPAGVLPSDVLASSPIVHGVGGHGSPFAASAAAPGGGSAMGGGDFGGFEEFGGVDPNMDPELAMALRVSMEEERARQERAAAAAAAAAEQETKDAEMTDVINESGGTGGASATTEASDAAKAPATSSSGPTAAAAMDIGLTEEEALLQQALAMSMNENDPVPPSAAKETKQGNDDDVKPAAVGSLSGSVEAKQKESVAVAMETDDIDEDAAMRLALEMSMQGDNTSEETGAKEESKQEGGVGGTQQLQDSRFVNELLGSLPGVDPNDPAIQNALRNMGDDKKDGEKKE